MLYIQNNESKKNNSSDQEFDIFLFFKFLLRNKFLIGKFSLVSLLLGIIFSFTIKNVYEGQFQIVLKKEEKQASVNGSFQNIIGLNETDDLKTEVGILESPSLLKPILKFILLSKDSKEISNLDEKFFSWRKNNLDVNLLKGTSILGISYRDEDKDIIIPVLQKMTLAYQDYSGRTKRRKEELTKTYLKNQIEKYQKKSSASLKAAQDFAIDEDLVFNNLNIDENSNLIQNNSLSTTNLVQTNIGFERDRVKAANQLRKIDLQIAKIKNLKDDVDELIYYGASIPALAKEGLPDELKKSENRLLTIDKQLESIESLNENDLEALQYIGASIPALVGQGLPQTLKNIESNLVNLRAKYTDDDINIINLIEKRKLTSSLLRERAIKYLNVEKTNIFLNREPRINLLKDRAIKYLKALRLEIESDMEAVMRPKEVILKYKELIREASRDEKTLISLEQQLRIIELEGAKTEDPWELITEPTLKNKPVEPSRILISLSFLILGTLLGVIFSIYKRRKSDLVEDSQNLENFFNVKIIENLSSTDMNLGSTKILFLKKFFNKLSGERTVLISLGEFKEENSKKLKKLLTLDKSKDKTLMIKSSLEFMDDTTDFENAFLITKLDKLKFKEIKELRKRLDFLNLRIKGIIVMN